MWNIKQELYEGSPQNKIHIKFSGSIATWEKTEKYCSQKGKGLGWGGPLLPAVHAIPKSGVLSIAVLGFIQLGKENPTSLNSLSSNRSVLGKVCKNVIKKGLIKTILLILRMLLDSVLLFPLKHNLVL